MQFIQDELKKDNDWVSKWISDGWKNEYCPIQVGFDRVILKLTLKSIDYDILQSAIDVCKLNEDNWIFTKTTSDQDISLNICKSNSVKYTYIKVNLGNNDILTITPTGKDRTDNCTLILHIAPHKYLGNIYNNCVCDEISFIHNKMAEIEQLTGLCFDRNYLELTEAEINMNFLYDLESMTFADIVNAIGAYQIMNKKSTNNGFSISTLKKSVVDAMTSSIIGKNKISIYTRYTDVDINIYDKSYEAKHGYNLEFDKDNDKIDMIQSNYLRIEFKFSKRGISTYLPSSNLNNLTQIDIEEAFKKIYRKYIHDNVVKYYRSWDLRLQKYFGQLDISAYKNRSAWKKDFLLDISAQLRNEGDGFLYLTKEELKSYIKLIPAPSVKKNANKIAEQILYEMESKRDMPIRIVDEVPYKVIDEFILNFSGVQEQAIWYLPNNAFV